MGNSLGMATLAAMVLASGAATAGPIVVGESGLVVDVEFWGTERIATFNPDDPFNDIITYGDPVKGEFRVFADDAPPPGKTLFFQDVPNAVAYGAAAIEDTAATSFSFVTSRWLSPVPARLIDGAVSPFPDSHAADSVQIADRIQFRKGEPLSDWLVVTDAFAERLEDLGEETLSIGFRTPLDIIQGVGLEQEFDIVIPAESRESTFGVFLDSINGSVRGVFQFVIDRVRATPRVCRA